MIANNFSYAKAENLAEAFSYYKKNQEENGKPFYLSGGTEIVSFSREKKISPSVVIDLKNIKECNDFNINEEKIFFGSCLTLNQVIEKNEFPALVQACKIIDNTVRNRLTLGGNILGKLPYRETVLPLLLAEAKIVYYCENGIKKESLSEVFDKKLQLPSENLVIGFEVDKEKANNPFYYERKSRAFDGYDYPIFTAILTKEEENIYFACTAIFNYALKINNLTRFLSNSNLVAKIRAGEAVNKINLIYANNFRANEKYLRNLLTCFFEKGIEYLEGIK